MPTEEVGLRKRLGCALGVLVATAAVCLVDPRATAVGAQLAGAVAAGAPPVLERPPSLPSPTPSVVAAPLRAAAGCGFTLGSSTTAALGHCTVVEIGDSLGSDLGWGLAREVSPASGLTLVQLDKSSTGLAVPSFYDWPSQLSKALVRYHPQLVVICLGGNDQQGMVVKGKPVQFGTPAWRTAYADRVRELAAEATRTGAFVVWVGLPVMQQPTYDRGTQLLDADYAAGVATLPRARYVSTRELFAGSDGAYAAAGVIAGTTVGLRESDGIHLSLAGENVVATYVLSQVAKLFGVAISATAPAVVKR